MRADSDLGLRQVVSILPDFRMLLLHVICLMHVSSGGGKIIRILKQLNTYTCSDVDRASRNERKITSRSRTQTKQTVKYNSNNKRQSLSQISTTLFSLVNLQSRKLMVEEIFCLAFQGVKRVWNRKQNIFNHSASSLRQIFLSYANFK